MYLIALKENQTDFQHRFHLDRKGYSRAGNLAPSFTYKAPFNQIENSKNDKKILDNDFTAWRRASKKILNAYRGFYCQ